MRTLVGTDAKYYFMLTPLTRRMARHSEQSTKDTTCAKKLTMQDQRKGGGRNGRNTCSHFIRAWPELSCTACGPEIHTE